MFLTPIIIGIYSYLIFALGISNNLYKEVITSLTILYGVICYLLIRSQINFEKIKKLINQKNNIICKKKIILLVLLLTTQVIINLVGTLGPELSFDALWYHLTLPKIFLNHHSISYIPGGLFYYSLMPKLTEMLYISSIAFQGETLAKVIHLFFGILTLFAIYKLSRKYLSSTFSLLVCILFYSNLVVGWESITAYVDLARTFFEVISFYFLLEFFETKKITSLLKSSIVLGLAITTKLLAIASLIIIVLLIIYYRFNSKNKIKSVLRNSILYIVVSLLIPLPWFIFAYVNSHNPFYPFFTSIYPISPEKNVWDMLTFIKDFWQLFISSPDPISPMYILSIPIIVEVYRRLNKDIKLMIIYCLISLLIWYFTPKTGGGRFILPYLPIFSLVVLISINSLRSNILKSLLLFVVLFLSVTSILYRSFANVKFLPVILGQETKQEFLKNHLDFSYGDFYDTDSYLKKKIHQTDKVLIIGIHNLYYIDFPFVHESYIRKNERFDYILFRGEILDSKYQNWKEIYKNDITKITLYAPKN